MSATTDTTNAQTEVPAWLNLDALGITDQEREGMAFVSSEFRAFVERIASASGIAKDLVTTVESKLDGLPEDVFPIVSHAVGLTEMLDLGRVIAGLLERGGMETMSSDYQTDLETRCVWGMQS